MAESAKRSWFLPSSRCESCAERRGRKEEVCVFSRHSRSARSSPTDAFLAFLWEKTLPGLGLRLDHMGECCPCSWLSELLDRCFDKRRDVEPGGKNEYSGAYKHSKSERDDMERDAFTPNYAVDGDVYMALWGFEDRVEEELFFLPGDCVRTARRSGARWSHNKIDRLGKGLATGFVHCI